VRAGDVFLRWVAREEAMGKAESGGENFKFQNPNDKGQRTESGEGRVRLVFGGFVVLFDVAGGWWGAG
jgi:hypothetical protein